MSVKTAIKFPGLAEGVSIKVSDTGKCVSVYGLYSKGVVNFTLEAYELLKESMPAIDKFVEENRDNLLTKNERQDFNKASRVEAKLLEQDKKTRIQQHALTLFKENNGSMTWAIAMQIAEETYAKAVENTVAINAA